MTSKEIINNHIVSLKEQAQIEKELKTGNEIYCEIEIEQYNQVLKDLEVLEKYKRVMCEPISDIMKRLKILDALKRNVGIRSAIQEWANKETKIFPNDRKIVKEWLDGK